jgi:tight adherence protein C
MTWVIFGLVAGLGVFAIVWSLVTAGGYSPGGLAARLAKFDEMSGVDPHDLELEKPLRERMLGPMVGRLGRFGVAIMPTTQLAQIDAKIVEAGGFGGLNASSFFGLQVVMAAIVAGLFGLMGKLVLSMDFMMTVLWILVGAFVGFFIPRARLNTKISKRREEILDGMPNALDLLTISVEAGLGFDASLLRVAEKYEHALAEEFTKVLAEMNLGRPRREAPKAMTERNNVEELTNFVQAVIQSEQMGSSLAGTLRIQAEEMRRRRRQRAEEQGAKAPLKMLLPMVGCIFPTLFIVLLGPALLSVIHTFTGPKG